MAALLHQDISSLILKSDKDPELIDKWHLKEQILKFWPKCKAKIILQLKPRY